MWKKFTSLSLSGNRESTGSCRSDLMETASCQRGFPYLSLGYQKSPLKLNSQEAGSCAAGCRLFRVAMDLVDPR